MDLASWLTNVSRRQAESEVEARASAALHALYRLIAYHKQHADVLAGTGPHPDLCCGRAVQIHMLNLSSHAQIS